MTHAPALALALAAAAIAGLLATRAPRAARAPTSAGRTLPTRVDTPRHLPLILGRVTIPPVLAALWRRLMGAGGLQVAEALGESAASRMTMHPLQLRLIHAGYRDPSRRALRLRQARAVGVLAVVGSGLILALALPLWLIGPVLVLTFPGGAVFVRIELARRVVTRQRTMRALAVPWLYQIAAFAAAGYALPDALREVERGDDTELSYETRRLLIQYHAGKPLREALAVFALRCNCPELTTAVRRMTLAQDAGRAPLAESMRRIAAATRTKITTERTIHRRRALNTNYGFLVLTAIPAVVVAATAPSLYEAVLRLHVGV